MALSDKKYLHIKIDGADYMLSEDASVAIEEREGLTLGTDADGPCAWRQSGIGRWAAWSLDRYLKSVHRKDWQRVIFIHALPEPVGLAVDEIKYPDDSEEVIVAPFVPIGRPLISAGHLFNGLRVDSDKPMLVFDPSVLGQYLRSLQGR